MGLLINQITYVMLVFIAWLLIRHLKNLEEEWTGHTLIFGCGLVAAFFFFGTRFLDFLGSPSDAGYPTVFIY